MRISYNEVQTFACMSLNIFHGFFTRDSVGQLTKNLFLFDAVLLAVIIRQRKPYRRKDGTILYFEGNSKLRVSGKFIMILLYASQIMQG